MPLFFFISGCLSKDDISFRQMANRLVGRLSCLMKPLANKVMAITEMDISIVMIPLMVVISISVCNLLIKPINKFAPIIIGNKKLNL